MTCSAQPCHAAYLEMPIFTFYLDRRLRIVVVAMKTSARGKSSLLEESRDDKI